MHALTNGQLIACAVMTLIAIGAGAPSRPSIPLLTGLGCIFLWGLFH